MGKYKNMTRHDRTLLRHLEKNVKVSAPIKVSELSQKEQLRLDLCEHPVCVIFHFSLSSWLTPRYF